MNFIITTKDGHTLYFTKDCNHVDYSDPNYAIFSHNYVDDRNISYSKTLAIIPHSNIPSVINKEEYLWKQKEL